MEKTALFIGMRRDLSNLKSTGRGRTDHLTLLLLIPMKEMMKRKMCIFRGEDLARMRRKCRDRKKKKVVLRSR